MITDSSLARYRQEDLGIAQAKAEFWEGLVAALKARGATVKRETGKQVIQITDAESVTVDCSKSDSITINGQHESLDLRAIRKAGTFSRTGVWSGSIQVVYREYRRPNLTWRTRKAGWPFDEIARELIAVVNRRQASDKAAKRRDRLEKDLTESLEYQRFLKDAHELGIYPSTTGERITMSLDLGFKGARAVLSALYAERLRVKTTSERHEEVVELLRARRKIEAIKLYRELYDTSLLDAKNAVEQISDELEAES